MIADALAIGQLVRSLVVDSLVDPEGEDAAGFYATLTPAEVARRKAMPSLFYAVAENSGKVLGMILVRDSNYVGQFFVVQEHQGKGIGSALWRFALERALQSGGTGEFTVLSSVSAKAIYERLGFVATGSPEVKHGFRFIPMHRGAQALPKDGLKKGMPAG